MILVPDFSFNQAASARNEFPGDNAVNAILTAQPSRNAAHSLTAVKLAQLSIKEVYIRERKFSAEEADIFVVTVVTDNLCRDSVKLHIQAFENIEAGSYLPFCPDGLVAYCQSPDRRPTFLDYRIVLIEAKKGCPDVESIRCQVTEDNKYQSVVNILGNVSKIAPPSSSLLAVASDIILNLTARTIKTQENNQLLYVRGSFDRRIDDMGIRYGVIAQSNSQSGIKYQVEMV